ncbi:type II toxin-antitoxin system VapC family toxin [Blastomonas sp.]|uniref:type II toxin-antitoxin system VapC family toxin n=1 Tax=Blastomonas sp. TaxID=1909299 RepID=UPI003593E8B0
MSGYILDTHALIWWWTDDPMLPFELRDIILADETIIGLSAASAWEIATKCRIGKLPGGQPLVDNFEDWREADDFFSLPVTVDHGLLAGSLPGDHRDPFDRMIAAQAIIEDLTVITRDPALAALGCRVVWE